MLAEVFFIVLLLWILFYSLKKPSNYPPGPWGLPCIGYIPSSVQNFYAKFQELRKKHGDIICWRFGSKIVVFMSDFQMVKEAYQTLPFAARPELAFLSILADQSNTETGMIFTNGAHWHNIRKFTLSHLRYLGMGKSKMVSAVQFEAMEFVKELKKQAGKQVPLPRTLKPAILNVIWQMVASKRYELDDENITELDNILTTLEQSFSICIFQDIFPFIKSSYFKKLLNTLALRKLQIKLSNQLIQIFESFIKEHIATLDANNPRDFIDEYLIEMEKQKSNPNSTMSTHDLMGCVTDLFTAGLETTAQTTYWSILYLAKFPKVQSKLQTEIDKVLPNETLATLDDKSRLPYTEAFINEVLRYSTIFEFGIPRSVLSDTSFRGYTIPKDAIILSTTAVLHFDPTYFDDPHEFRPERFLNNEGKVQIPKAGLFPFGLGKRSCVGESLARMELFIFITTMVKYLSFSEPPNKALDISPMDIPLLNQPRQPQDLLISIRK